MSNRRHWLRAAAASAAAVTIGDRSFADRPPPPAASRDALAARYELIDAAAARPVVDRDRFADPVVIESAELLRHENSFLCRVRSTDGAEGVCVGHNIRMPYLHPIQTQLVNPYFVGKDARDLDSLVDGVYLHRNNYKLQGMALWIPVATIEFAILDMLGNIAGVPMGELIGGRRRERVAVYQANNHRGRSAEETVDRIGEVAESTGVRALKFKIGGRMANVERPADRTERLIPAMRDAFPDHTLYADANGSYGVDDALRVGGWLQDSRIDLFEGPLPFDWYEDIRHVASRLKIPIAGGEGEASMRNYRWIAANDCFDVFQHDLFYFGGMIRSLRVARMAEAMGHTCMPHISGTGLGYAYMLQFVSALPNAADYHEFKRISDEIPATCETSSLRIERGEITVPAGPGDGIDLDPNWVRKHRPV